MDDWIRYAGDGVPCLSWRYDLSVPDFINAGRPWNTAQVPLQDESTYFASVVEMAGQHDTISSLTGATKQRELQHTRSRHESVDSGMLRLAGNPDLLFPAGETRRDLIYSAMMTLDRDRSLESLNALLDSFTRPIHNQDDAFCYPLPASSVISATLAHADNSSNKINEQDAATHNNQFHCTRLSSARRRQRQVFGGRWRVVHYGEVRCLKE